MSFIIVFIVYFIFGMIIGSLLSPLIWLLSIPMMFVVSVPFGFAIAKFSERLGMKSSWLAYIPFLQYIELAKIAEECDRRANSSKAPFAWGSLAKWVVIAYLALLLVSFVFPPINMINGVLSFAVNVILVLTRYRTVKYFDSKNALWMTIVDALTYVIQILSGIPGIIFALIVAYSKKKA